MSKDFNTSMENETICKRRIYYESVYRFCEASTYYHKSGGLNMPVEQSKPFFFFQIGDVCLPVYAIKEYPVSDKSENKHYNNNSVNYKSALSFSLGLNDEDVQNWIMNCLGVKRRYFKRKYTKRNWHLIKYSKTKRVRHKNWKRSFGEKQ